jgi:hypothetical protein
MGENLALYSLDLRTKPLFLNLQCAQRIQQPDLLCPQPLDLCLMYVQDYHERNYPEWNLKIKINEGQQLFRDKLKSFEAIWWQRVPIRRAFSCFLNPWRKKLNHTGDL